MDTVLEFLRDRAEDTAANPAIYQIASDGAWQPTTWSALWSQVNTLARGLRVLGLNPGDRLAIIAPSSLEWELTHLATLMNAAVIIGLDAHDTATRLQKVLRDAEVTGLVIKDRALLKKIFTLPPSIKFVVCMDDTISDDPAPKLVSWRALMKSGDGAALGNQALPKAESPATIIYTSGTTGEPKGITYTHGQLALACEAILATLPAPRPGARFVCWLPLSNLFQRIMNLCAMATGSAIYMVPDPSKVLDFVPGIAPDVFIGVPRFYEKLANGIKAKLAQQTGLRRGLCDYGLAVGRQYSAALRAGQAPGMGLKLRYWLADWLVLSRLRGLMGGRLQYMISGSAPIPIWILEFFHSFGWLVLEAYGLSENILPMAMNTPTAYRFGSVGKLLPANQVKLGDGGGISVAGPGVFSGYRGDTTKDYFVDGYYQTGDVGEIDDQGYLRLTGRNSDIIKTSAGRRIALPPIEAVLREVPWVDHALVVGTSRKCLLAVLTLDNNALGAAPALDLGPLQADISAKITALAKHERPAGALLLTKPFSVDGGELTTNLKLRRQEIERKYREPIDALFAEIDRGGPLEQQSNRLVVQLYE